MPGSNATADRGRVGRGAAGWLAAALRARSLRPSWIGLVALLAAVGLARLSAQAPFSNYDDRAIWGLKAKALLA
ncbi:MAG: hypothetical protein JSU87_05535, partial [Gemmatimonadota bacterium]